MNKKSKVVSFCLLFMVTSPQAFSAAKQTNNLEIQKIRAVGNYNAGTTYDNSIELWFSSAVEISGTNCTIGYRVYVDAKYTHIISAAYMAFASGKKVNIQVDDLLPIRNGSCEISYLDVLK